AVRQGDWKYLEAKESNANTGILGKPQETKTELFNLSYDPSERTNVIDDYPEIAKQMKALFDKFPGKTEN
ncbi:MAG: sulfatase, partial [Bacteroidota bacterium]|nr:sulfatase [Bacteroidota bacterium]